MTLKEYLEKNKISIENAAKDLGFSYEDIPTMWHFSETGFGATAKNGGYWHERLSQRDVTFGDGSYCSQRKIHLPALLGKPQE